MVRVGFFSYLGGTRDAAEVYAETIDQFQAAEAFGYDAVWVAQHHFGPVVGTLPSPLPFLANVAARTSRVRLGTAVIILPAEQPVRLAEDAAVVDLLSGGRLELGVGSGTDPAVFAALGVDPDRRRELMTTNLDILQRLFRGTEVTPGQKLHPPAPGLAGRIWQGVFTPDRAVQAARAGTHLLLPKASPNHPDLNPTRQAEATRAFKDTWPAGRVALSRPVYVSTDRRSAIEELGRELAFQTELATRQTPGVTLRDYLESGAFHLGSPEEVTASLRADPAVPLADDLIIQVGHHGPGAAHTLRSLELFATKVIPHLS